MPRYHCPHCGRFCKPNRNSEGTCGACLPPLHDEEHRMKEREEMAEHLAAHKRVLDRFFGGLF